VEIDANAPSHPFPISGKKCLARPRHLVPPRKATGTICAKPNASRNFEYVRFHAIFHDEVGVYDEDASGKPAYNFSYVDQIYDGLLENKVRPFIELSFMPKKLTSDPNALHPFGTNRMSRPKDWNKWDQLIEAFTRHLVQRYGEAKSPIGISKYGMRPNLDFLVWQSQRAHLLRAIRSHRPRHQACQLRLRVADHPQRKPPGPTAF